MNPFSSITDSASAKVHDLSDAVLASRFKNFRFCVSGSEVLSKSAFTSSDNFAFIACFNKACPLARQLRPFSFTHKFC